MPLRRLALAGVMVSAFAVPGLADIPRPPAELPPSGFKGAEYVDSAGCVFLRGEVGDRVTWVARISRERRQMCGLAPTFAPNKVAAATPAAVPPAAATVPVRHRPAPSRAATGQPTAKLRAVTITCPAHAPFARRFAVPGGGTKVLCISKDVEIEAFALPKGYRRAWTDDRLNPLRGLGTAEGDAMQDQIWTRKVPARLIE